ncbi:MAG: hypothetical protein GF399_00970 [Candidatus Coatesbacteria bacterium]|nr:hypothetical protein [Candidatus Coatesbacteria bacterium]
MTIKRVTAGLLLLVCLAALPTGAAQREADAVSVARDFEQLAGFYRQWSDFDGQTRALVRRVYDELTVTARGYIDNWRKDPAVLYHDDTDLVGDILLQTERIESQLNLLTETGAGGEINEVTATDFYGVELDKAAGLFYELGELFDGAGI